MNWPRKFFDWASRSVRTFLWDNCKPPPWECSTVWDAHNPSFLLLQLLFSFEVCLAVNAVFTITLFYFASNDKTVSACGRPAPSSRCSFWWAAFWLQWNLVSEDKQRNRYEITTPLCAFFSSFFSFFSSSIFSFFSSVHGEPFHLTFAFERRTNRPQLKSTWIKP